MLFTSTPIACVHCTLLCIVILQEGQQQCNNTRVQRSSRDTGVGPQPATVA